MRAIDSKLICGDALDRSLIPEESADLIVTSPPYNVGKAYSGKKEDDLVTQADYLDFTRQWVRNALAWTRQTGRICINVTLDSTKGGNFPLSAFVTTIALSVGWRYATTIVWDKRYSRDGTAWGSWRSASAPKVVTPLETVIVLYKGEWKRDRDGESDVSAKEFMDWTNGHWRISPESAARVGHDAPFPVQLALRCVALFSYVGDTVLDPFCGSGTTLVAAINNGRVAIGVEREERYVELARSRIVREANARL